jgi:murein DD-endopeptidase
MVSLSLDPPPSARDGRSPSRGPRIIALLVLVLLAAGAGFAAGRWTAPGRRLAAEGGEAPARPAAAAVAAQPAAPPASQPAPAPAPAALQQAAMAPAAAPAAAPTAAPAPAAPAPPAAGPRRVVVTLDGALEDSITAALPAEDRPLASELTQVVNRLLVWNLQVARDGRKGDKLELLYTPAPPATAAVGAEPSSTEPVVEAIRYTSQKLNSIIAAYRFRAPGARWARYFRPDGTELEERLVDSPTPEYDQITSLLRDGRRHKGVDFRVPVGTPVHATFDGVIERRNWNFAGNGNCLDVRDAASGRHAIFLHLEVLPKEMVPGRRVKKGEQIASSGNSGHSFAPHLHYQLEADDHRVLDPFEVQPVRRAALDAAARPAFDAERTRLDAALSGAVAAAPAPAAPPAPAAAAK